MVLSGHKKLIVGQERIGKMNSKIEPKLMLLIHHTDLKTIRIQLKKSNDFQVLPRQSKVKNEALTDNSGS